MSPQRSLRMFGIVFAGLGAPFAAVGVLGFVAAACRNLNTISG